MERFSPPLSLSGRRRYHRNNTAKEKEEASDSLALREPSLIPFDGARARASNPNAHAVRVIRDL